MEILKGVIFVLCIMGISYELFRIGRNIYYLFRMSKLQYYREHLSDNKEMFLKGAEMVYGKIKQTYSNTMILLEKIKCEEDRTEWIYDISQYEDKKRISIQITHPFKDELVKKPFEVLLNHTVYVFESGAVLWQPS